VKKFGDHLTAVGRWHQGMAATKGKADEGKAEKKIGGNSRRRRAAITPIGSTNDRESESGWCELTAKAVEDIGKKVT
jgi:hypothetical protein